MDKLYGIDTEYFIGIFMKNIVILGGGTAGWLTALLARYYYPDFPVTLIESEEIGILGAGEGTTPHIYDVLRKLNISFSDLVINCKATVKHGINFVNWNGDEKRYFHSFGVDEQLDEFKTRLPFKQFYEGHKINDLSYSMKLTSNNLVGFSYRINNRSGLEDPINSFYQQTTSAIHFDARLLAKYLREVAESRNILRVEGKLKQTLINEHGEINKLILEDGTAVGVDFIFDCSGFARLLIGKFFNTDWFSYSKHLPMKKAVPFFIEHDGDTSPQTDAIAMKYGWIWRIPVEGRYGCGYVFDSDYIDEDQALKEAEDYFGRKLVSPKTFKFDPGTFKETLVKNCMAVGLAQSFVEPLEATSIWISILNLGEFFESNGLFVYNTVFNKTFNKNCLERNQEVLEFLYLHYLTERKDSPFWIEFRKKNLMVPSVQDKIELVNNLLNPQTKYFTYKSWVEVSDGLGLIKQDYFKRVELLFDYNILERDKNSFLKNQNNMLKTCLKHKEFLEYIKNCQ
jgi:tryptophan 7-halogenase